MNVGRKRHVADRVEDGEKVVHWSKFEEAVAEPSTLTDLGFKDNCAAGRGKDEALANGNLPARSNQRMPEIFACGLGQHHFNAACGLLMIAKQSAARIETCRNH